MDNIKLANAILRSLRKLSHWSKDTVVKQMKENMNFPKAIAQYIIQTKKKKMEGDGFVLLNDMFFDTDFKAVTSEKFVKALLNSLGVIQEAEIFSSIVWIITMVGLDLMGEGDGEDDTIEELKIKM